MSVSLIPAVGPKVGQCYFEELQKAYKDGFTAAEVSEAKKAVLDARMISRSTDGALLQFLASQGIERSRLVARGYGETEPVADNGTPAGRERNRRVEFDVLN